MPKKEIRIALIGHQFMGIAHSNAYRNTAMWIDLPVRITMKCLCANNTMDIVEDVPFSPDFEDGVKCQEILEAVEKSAVNRKWI
jgi:hypothetical protein